MNERANDRKARAERQASPVPDPELDGTFDQIDGPVDRSAERNSAERQDDDGSLRAASGGPKVFGYPVSLVVAVAVGVVLMLTLALLATREPAGLRTAGSPLVGRQAPPIVGKTIDGKDFDLAAFNGRYVVVNFFASWCVPCVREHPALVAFGREQRRTGNANLVSVVFDDDSQSVRDFFARNGGDWPVVEAETKTVAEWGVAGVPESYIVGPDGKVATKLVGGIKSAEELQSFVDSLAQGGK